MAISLSLDIRGQGAVRIREAQQQGWIQGDLDPMTVVDLAVGLCMMWHQNWEVTANLEGVDLKNQKQVDALHEKRLKHITDVLLHGMLNKK